LAPYLLQKIRKNGRYLLPTHLLDTRLELCECHRLAPITHHGDTPVDAAEEFGQDAVGVGESEPGFGGGRGGEVAEALERREFGGTREPEVTGAAQQLLRRGEGRLGGRRGHLDLDGVKFLEPGAGVGADGVGADDFGAAGGAGRLVGAALQLLQLLQLLAAALQPGDPLF